MMSDNREKAIKVLNDALAAKENYPCAKAEMSFEFIEMLIDILKEQKQVKTYGRLYSVSPKAVTENRNEFEMKLYEDICKCLMENGVLVIHSELDPMDVTYGWKLKGVAQDA